MKTLDKSIEVMSLYDVYQDLLTEKQQSYFESYYYNDYSITEISENNNVSRNAVHDLLKRTVSKLYDFESKLQLVKTNKERQIIISRLKEENNDPLIANLIDELEKVE